MSAALILPIALHRHAGLTPDATAILEPGRAWTFAALDRHADALALGLARAGVRAGDRVALLAAPSGGAIALLAAAGRIGACVAPLGTSLTAPELAAAIIVIGPALVVHDEAHARPAGALGIRSAHLGSLAAVARGAAPAAATGAAPAGGDTTAAPAGGDTNAAPAAATGAAPAAATGVPVPAPVVDPNAAAVAILTSGTTGRPKAALLSHAAMAASAAAWSAVLPDARGWLLCVGLAHVAGLGVAWRAIGAGVPLRLIPAFDADAVLEALRDGPASHLSLVPTQLARLLDASAAAGAHVTAGGSRAAGGGPGAVDRDDGHPVTAGVRAVLLGGAPIPPGLVTRALAAGWPVVPTYGLTEAGSGVTALVTADAAAHPESAGRPLPGVLLRIADAAADGTGEIQVHTAAAFSGYLGMPEASAAAFEEGAWLRTGDAGRLDRDGFLHVIDRRDDVLVSGGENVFPAEVEAALAQHPAIAEAGVAGRPDPTWGAVPVASVVLRPGAPTPTAGELRAFCLARLAPYKVPAAFLVVGALPRTTSGKLRRSELRAALPATPSAASVEAPA